MGLSRSSFPTCRVGNKGTLAGGRFKTSAHHLTFLKYHYGCVDLCHRHLVGGGCWFNKSFAVSSEHSECNIIQRNTVVHLKSIMRFLKQELPCKPPGLDTFVSVNVCVPVSKMYSRYQKSLRFLGRLEMLNSFSI